MPKALIIWISTLLIITTLVQSQTTDKIEDEKWRKNFTIVNKLEEENKYSEAISLGNTVFNYFERRDTLTAAKIKSTVALSQYKSGKIQEAINTYQFITQYLGNKDPLTKAIVFNQMGNIWADEMNNHSKALEYYEQSLSLKLKNSASPQSIANSYNNIGLSYRYLLDSAKAVQSYQIAIEYINKTENPIGIFNPLNNLGNLYKYYNDYQQAYKMYSRALTIVDKLSSRNKLILYSNLGSLNIELSKYDSAIYFLNITRALAIELKRKKEQADSEKNLASAYLGLNKFEEALKFNISAGIIFDSLNNIERKNALADLMLKYESTKKDNEILEAKQQIIKQEKDKELLELEKELSDKKVAITIQQSKLKEKELLNEKNQLLLKNKSDSLIKTTQILAQQIKINKAANELLQKEKAIEKQTYWLFGLSFFLVSLFGIIYFQIKRKQSIEKQSKLEMEIAKQEALNKVQEERLRISRELHDNIGSHLTLMNATVEQLPLLNEVDIKPQIETVKNSLVMSMKELRRTVWLMNKSKITLEELGIKLRDFLKPVNTSQTEIKLKVTGDESIILNELAAAHLFRIVQEGVNNAIKYANANIIDIHLNGKNQSIQFLISDNGKGFNITNESKGNGIKNIEYRVKELNGSVEWGTNTGGGTQINGYFTL